MNLATLDLKHFFTFSSWSISHREKCRIASNLTGVYLIDGKPYVVLTESYYDEFLNFNKSNQIEVLKFIYSRYDYKDSTHAELWYNIDIPVVVERTDGKTVSLEFVFKPLGNVHEHDLYTFRDIAKRTFGWYRVSSIKSNIEDYSNAVITFKAEEKTAMVLSYQYKKLSKGDIDAKYN